MLRRHEYESSDLATPLSDQKNQLNARFANLAEENQLANTRAAVDAERHRAEEPAPASRRDARGIVHDQAITEGEEAVCADRVNRVGDVEVGRMAFAARLSEG